MMRLAGIATLGLALLGGLSAPSFAPALWPDMADPTNDEQLVLELINRARANPIAEATRVGLDPLGGIGEGVDAADLPFLVAKPPLAMSATLLGIARTHSDEMWTSIYFAHNDLAGKTPAQRATAAGYSWNSFGENIAASSGGSAAALEDLLMVDHNYPFRGHRLNLLSVYDGSYPLYREVGIGYHLGTSLRDFPPTGSPSGDLKDFITEDFGRRANGPFLLGVVWNDTGNPFYAIGTGLSGVTISLTSGGSYYAVTSSSGGYSFPVGSSGTVFVTATGGTFGSAVVTKAVTLTGENVKVDFKSSDLSITDSDSDGLPDSWETAHFPNLGQGPTDDPDGDFFDNLAEFNAGTDPMDAGSKPIIAGPPVITPTSKGGGGGGGGCGLTGLETVLLLALLRFRRR